MESPTNPNSAETHRWLERAAAGDAAGWRELVGGCHDRLRRMVAVRLDPRLRGRVDPSDVLQEAYLEASAHLADYVRNPTMPFFLWMRLLAGARLSKLHRRHLGAQRRDIGREVSLYSGALPEASSAALAAQLLGRETAPSEAAVRTELRASLEDALNQLGALDREVLTLRHFEQLTTGETARVLGISEAAAGKRYIRALTRLKGVLTRLPGGGGVLP
jgi:RNA polymerase sigma-70 factor (ECF subfamily)